MAASPEFDLLVVGSGAAGIPAALFASAAGARVLMIEVADEIGGTFHLSSGQMSAAGTRVQAARGIVDTPDLHYEDVMRINRGTANPALVRLAVDNAADTLHWLLDIGLELEPHHPVIHQGHQPYAIARTYWAPEGGVAILKRLRPLVADAVAAGRLEVRTGTRMTRLLTDDAGTVIGAEVTGADGASYPVHAARVLLASGGYTANPALFSSLSMGRPHYGGGYPHGQGDGLLAATAIGAGSVGEDQYLPGFAGVRQPAAWAGYEASTQTYPQWRMPWEVYLDQTGKRFLREDEPSVDTRERALLALPAMRFWAVYDSAILRAAPPFVVDGTPEEVAARFGSNPAYVKARSLAELAALTGMDAATVEASISAYNAAIVQGSPDETGREHRPLPVAEAPFYAIEHIGWSIVGFAGLAIDAELRVLRADGQPIPGLYAAGEIIGLGQTSGNAFCGGMSVTPAMTFGRLAGQRLGAMAAATIT